MQLQTEAVSKSVIKAFVQTLKHCFSGLSRLAKTKFQGFPGLKKLVFEDFSGYTPFTNMVA